MRSSLAVIRLRALAGAHLLLHRLLHVGRRDVAHMGGDRPAMPEWILDLAVAVAPEHLADRHCGFGAGAHRLRRDRVDIFDVKMDGDRRALERLRSECAPLGISSTSMTVESPMRIMACMSRPFGPGNREISVALNARL